MKIYYAVTAADYDSAAAPGRNFAFVACRIGPDNALLVRNLPLATVGALLTVSDRDAPEVTDPEELAAQAAGLCLRRGSTGIAADFEGPVRADLGAFLTCLGRRMRNTGRTLYLPRTYADAAPESRVLLCTAVSGGTFQEYLQEAAEQYGGARLALDAERLRMDFRLPAPTGTGEALSGPDFAALSEGRAVFFSPDLCARYFTYTKDGEAHFVLFDDADTLNRKLALGERYGVGAAFFQWPEVADIAGELRRE